MPLAVASRKQRLKGRECRKKRKEYLIFNNVCEGFLRNIYLIARLSEKNVIPQSQQKFVLSRILKMYVPTQFSHSI